MTRRWHDLAEGTRLLETAFPLDLTLLCGTDWECWGWGSNNKVRARGHKRGRADGGGNNLGRAIGPESYLRCQYDATIFIVLTLGGNRVVGLGKAAGVAT